MTEGPERRKKKRLLKGGWNRRSANYIILIGAPFLRRLSSRLFRVSCRWLLTFGNPSYRPPPLVFFSRFFGFVLNGREATTGNLVWMTMEKLADRFRAFLSSRQFDNYRAAVATVTNSTSGINFIGDHARPIGMLAERIAGGYSAEGKKVAYRRQCEWSARRAESAERVHRESSFRALKSPGLGAAWCRAVARPSASLGVPLRPGPREIRESGQPARFIEL